MARYVDYMCLDPSGRSVANWRDLSSSDVVINHAKGENNVRWTRGGSGLWPVSEVAVVGGSSRSMSRESKIATAPKRQRRRWRRQRAG